MIAHFAKCFERRLTRARRLIRLAGGAVVLVGIALALGLVARR